jgi:asparagine synthase (glutamine-hydrolysing)
MCGIVGMVGYQRQPDPDLTAAMADVLRHRGPDESGSFSAAHCTMAVRRLAIQDVTFGHQPAFSESRSVVAVLNGEIYNFPELRSDLLRRGHRLASRSDTEVIPHLYEDFGDDFVHHLDGMFAVALWDETGDRLVLVRDRLGKKPLYYSMMCGGFRFASEIKALFADPSLPREPDLAALHHYLVLQYVPGPRTAFQGIMSVEPGERLVVENGRIRTDRYWRLEPRPDHRIRLDEAAHLVREGLRQAVAKRLRSDVPVGAFLSGGVDSACVVATMSELLSEPVRTFTIGFEEDARDERVLARATAQALGTEHSEHVVHASVAGILPLLAWHHDEPLADDAIVPYYVLAKETRRAVTVALSGEGGDEAFAGYPRMWQVANGTGVPDLATAYADSVRTFPEEMLRGMYTPYMADATAGISTKAMLRAAFPDSGDALSRVLHADYMGRLPGCQLPKVDITTMAASLEARSPMLDHQFVEMASNLPSTVKFGSGGAKLALRQAFRTIVPGQVLDGHKRGFNLPLETWFRRELRPAAWSLLDSPESSIRTLLAPDAIRTLLRAHEGGAADHGLRILSLVCLELWLRTYIDRPPQLEPPAEVHISDL